jgi:hypothetical protein
VDGSWDLRLVDLVLSYINLVGVLVLSGVDEQMVVVPYYFPVIYPVCWRRKEGETCFWERQRRRRPWLCIAWLAFFFGFPLGTRKLFVQVV